MYRTRLGVYTSFDGVKLWTLYCKQCLDKRCGIRVKCRQNDDYILQEVGVIIRIVGFMYYSFRSE